MRKIVVITLFLILTSVGVSVLSAGVSPNSPDYDAWKQNQAYTPEVVVVPTNPSSPVTIVDNQDKDQCELLIPYDTSFTLAMAANDDASTGEMALPFVFTLYGANYNSCWINNNGNVSFDGSYGTYSAAGFPSASYVMCAPFWGDVDTRGTGYVWYRMDSNRLIVIWDHVGYYSGQVDKVNTFELIISNGTDATIGLGNNVAFSYADMAWTTGSASGGTGGFYGTPANVGINKGDGVYYAQIGRFDHPGTDYDGPYDLNDGVDWLDCQLFLFNTGGEASNVAPIFVTTPPSPVDLFVGDTWNFTVSVISPEAAQTTGAIVTTDFPLGYVVTPGNTCTIAFSYLASAADVGTHLVTIVATDDGTPNLSATTEFEIVVTEQGSGFTYWVNSFDLFWYTGNGYEFPGTQPAFLDANDLGSEILFNGFPFAPPVYTPYIFGALGNEPFVAGTYSVVKPLYSLWLPDSVEFVSITTDYETDFLGQPDGDTPVELSSFTAVLTANNYVQLTWVSQSETNMLGYRVYRNDTNNQANSVMITPILIPATNTSSQQNYSVTDPEVEIGATYYYWLESVDVASSQFFGPLSIIVEGDVPPVVPEVSSMKNAYPNPFKANDSTSIEVALKGGETGTVTVYNLLGQVVRSFTVSEGTHTINWNGKDSNGAACSSGIYFYKLSTPSINQTKKMVIIK